MEGAEAGVLAAAEGAAGVEAEVAAEGVAVLELETERAAGAEEVVTVVVFDGMIRRSDP